MIRPFRDRREAGRRLAKQLQRVAAERPVVLALPRGGVPVGFEVATALGAPLDVFVVRKLGAPSHEEIAIGAIASGGSVVLNPDVISSLGVPPDSVKRVARAEASELLRRERVYRGDHPALPLRGRSVVLVDDGLATGASMRAAVAALRPQRPLRIVVAVPIASIEACREVSQLVDETVCALTPRPFEAVSLWYEDFEQTSDDEVRLLLERSRQREAAQAAWTTRHLH